MLMSVVPAPLALAGLLYLSSRPSGAPSANEQEAEIPQPSGWVAFAADFTTTEPGRPDLLGHYYRGADGSFRVEQQTNDRAMRYVAISNVSAATAYLFHSPRGQTWVKRPMLLPPTGFKPLRRRNTMRRLTVHMERVHGFDTYRYVDPTGSVQLQVPALNFFSLLTVKPSGKREVYDNVKIGDQPLELFQPPAGAQIEYDARPIPNGVPVTALGQQP